MTVTQDPDGKNIGDLLREAILEIENDPNRQFSSYSIQKTYSPREKVVHISVSFGSEPNRAHYREIKFGTKRPNESESKSEDKKYELPHGG